MLETSIWSLAICSTRYLELSPTGRVFLTKSVIAKRIFLVLAVLSIVDVFVGVSSGFFHNVEFFSEKSSARIVSDLAFIEGAFVFIIRALFALVYSSFKLREIALMIIGAAMIGMSVVFGIFA